jgi:TonB family protein
LKPKEKFRSAPGFDPLGCLQILSSELFLAFLLCQSVVAQEAGGNPEGHTPKTGDVAIPLSTNSVITPPPAKSTSVPDTISNLGALATELLSYPAAASCSKKNCTILVTNFVLPDGSASQYGMQLADELSKELASQNHKIQVIDRGLLQNFLAKDLVPAKSVNAGLVHSIASALKARFVVLGTTKRTNDDVVQLSTRLFDVADKYGSGYNAVVNLLAPKSSVDLSPSELTTSLPPITSTVSGESIYRSGVDGVSTPKCTYMPNPQSEEVRKFLLSGNIFVDAVVNSEGKVENVRIIRGLPDGLNDRTIATMKTWRCNPALKDGKPVATRVWFEIKFLFTPN